MKTLLQKYRARQAKNRRTWAGKWEETRARGFWRFVLKSALLCSFSAIFLISLFDYFWDGDFLWGKVPLKLSFSLFCNLPTFMIVWWLLERQYKRFLETPLAAESANAINAHK